MLQRLTQNEISLKEKNAMEKHNAMFSTPIGLEPLNLSERRQTLNTPHQHVALNLILEMQLVRMCCGEGRLHKINQSTLHSY